MDKNTLIELVPHYIGMLILVFGILGIVQLSVGQVGFFVEFAIVVTIAVAYRPLVLRLGIAPSTWE
ncbi:MAG: hypothetical protein J07HN6_00099 [Halonotius sp. J07HN6]|jgi:hypothetical protein|nr:MAG: hypothetical protein J07HN6_00099 [Halonotius sp. J07HN6]